MKSSIILIGGGGHCKSVIDVIEQEGRFEITGIVDLKNNIGKNLLSYSVIACDEELGKLNKVYDYFFITLGQLKSPSLRRDLFKHVKNIGGNFPIIISPFAYVSKHTNIEEGSIIMHHSFINAGVSIGKNCIINSKALVEHDSIIGDYCHIATSAVINADCSIGEGVFIGSNATINRGLEIGENAIIGSGTVVTKNVPSRVLIYGNPGIIISHEE